MAKIETIGYTDEPLNPVYSTGKNLKTVVAKFQTSASGNVNIVLLRGLTPTSIIRGIRFPRGTAAVSGLTDVDFGIFSSDGQKAIVQDAIADGVSFSTANANAYDIVGKNITNYDDTKTIAELAGVQNKDMPIGGYCLCAHQTTGGLGTFYCEISYED